MKTVEVSVYQFSELSESAKEKAISDFRVFDEYSWSQEVLQSVEDGLEHFGASLSDYSIDWNNINCSSWKISFPEQGELSGVRLWKYLQNNHLTYWNKYQKKTDELLSGNCPFTGVCFDEDFLDNIRKFIKRPDSSTFEDLLEESVWNCFNAGCKDYEYQQSDEAITEMIEANDYEFTEDGERF